MLRDIQSLVSPTAGETLLQKVVTRLRGTVVSSFGGMARPESGPASPEPRLGLEPRCWIFKLPINRPKRPLC